ncbi:unnamed protein product [Chrysoparadoxa australica]
MPPHQLRRRVLGPNEIDGDGLTPLMRACWVNNLPLVRDLLNQGADACKANAGGWTALMSASRAEDPEIVVALLEAGADVHAASCTARTALHLAAMRGVLSTVKQLLHAGANPCAKTSDGETPADLCKGAAAESHPPVADKTRKAVLDVLTSAELWHGRRLVVMLQARHQRGDAIAALFTRPTRQESDLRGLVLWLFARLAHEQQELYRLVVSYL